MTTEQYLEALRELGLSPASKATARALGVTVRQCQRYARGVPIPKTTELLLRCYLERANNPDRPEFWQEVRRLAADSTESN